MADSAIGPVQYYSRVHELIQSDDLLGWRKLQKDLHVISNRLLEWGTNDLFPETPSRANLSALLDAGTEIISPWIVTAMASVEGRRKDAIFQNQVLHALLSVPSWPRSGFSIWVEFPFALASIYHFLHGTICVTTEQSTRALEFAEQKISLGDLFVEIWQAPPLLCLSEHFRGEERTHVDYWHYIMSAWDRFPWIREIFAADTEYMSSLLTYGYLLLLREMAHWSIKLRDGVRPEHIDATLLSVLLEHSKDPILSLAKVRVLSDPKGTRNIWESRDVSSNQMLRMLEIMVNNQHRSRPFIRFSDAIQVLRVILSI